MRSLTKRKKKEENGVVNVPNQAASFHWKVIFRSINLDNYINIYCECAVKYKSLSVLITYKNSRNYILLVIDKKSSVS